MLPYCSFLPRRLSGSLTLPPFLWSLGCASSRLLLMHGELSILKQTLNLTLGIGKLLSGYKA